MKIKNLFYVSLAALSLAACSKDEAPTPDGGVTFKLLSTPSVTKAVNTSSVDSEGLLNSATVYLFNQTTGDYVASSTISPNATAGSLTVNVPAGTYDVVAVANTTQGSVNKSALNAADIALLVNTRTSFVMYGAGSKVEVVSGQNTESQDITVSRLVAALQLGTITFSFDNTVDAFYKTALENGDVKVKSLELKSSKPSISLDGTTVGKGSEISGNALMKTTAESFTNGKLTKGQTAIAVTADGVAGHAAERVYGIPETAPVVQLCLTYGTGKDAVDRYYNIDLSQKIGTQAAVSFEKNTLYSLSMTLTGTGSTDPGSKDAITLWKVKSTNWATGKDIDGGSVGN